jgi:putative MATE family efflux protein
LNNYSLLGNRIFYRKALSIALPIMLQQLIQSMVSLIDNFMVAGLGDVSMSGVNIANQILFVFMIFLNTICMSGGIYLTQFFGAGDPAGMKQAFRFKLIAGLAAFIPYFLVCIVFPRQVLSLMVIGNTEAALILDQGVMYIRIMFLMGLQMTISVCIATSLRDTGQVRIPLVISIIATLTNTFFNWILIYGHLGLPALGVRGAAFATVIARTVELILYIAVCLRLKPDFVIKPLSVLHVDAALFKDILRKGLMVLVSEMTWVLSETITTAIYNGRGGADVVSGMAAGFAIANLFFVAFGGITSATSVIMGSTLGAGKLEEAKKQKTWLLSGSVVLGLIMFLFGLSTTLIVPYVFGRLSAGAVQICRQMVILNASFLPVWLYMNCQLAVARSGGDTAMGAYADALITIFVMIPMLFALAFLTDMGPVRLYFWVKTIDIVKIVVFHLWLKRERWLRNLAEGY